MADAGIRVTFTADNSSIQNVHKAVQKYFDNNLIKVTFDTGSIKQAQQVGQQAGKALQKGLAGSSNSNPLTGWIKNGTVNDFERFAKQMGGTLQEVRSSFVKSEDGANNLLQVVARVSNEQGKMITLQRSYNAETGKATPIIQRQVSDLKQKTRESEKAAKAQAKYDNTQIKYGADWQNNQILQLKSISGAGLGVDTKQLGHSLGAVIGQYRNLFKNGQFTGTQADFDKLIEKARLYESTLKNANQTVNQLNRSQEDMSIGAQQHHGLSSYMTQYAEKIQKNAYWSERFNSMLSETQKMMNGTSKYAGGAQALQTDVARLKEEFASSGAAADTFRDRLKNLFNHHWDVALIMVAIRAIKQGIQQMWVNVKEIDAALTQLRIVTKASSSEMKAFSVDIAKTAKSIGSDITSVAKSVEDFARLGYSLQDSLDLSRVTNIFANVGAIGIEDATSGTIAIMKAFGKEASDVEGIIDMLVKVDQEYAVSTGDLAEALSNGGAALEAANNSLEQSIALVTAGNAAVQDASKTGNALKTTSMRIRGATAELEDAGEEIDSYCKSTSKMREEVMALSGVDIMLDEDTFKSTYDIMIEIAKVWDSLSDINQAALLEALAGKRNATVVKSIITNINDLEGSYESATNAAGKLMCRYVQKCA